MAFVVKYPVRFETNTNGRILKQLSSFNYIGFEVSATVDFMLKGNLI